MKTPFEQLEADLSAIEAEHKHEDARELLAKAVSNCASALDVAILENHANGLGARAYQLRKEADRA